MVLLPPQRVRVPRGVEGAFTMVELMVGLILLGLLLAMVGGPLVSALNGAAKTEATAGVERMVEDAEDRFSTDTMAAFTPDRERSRIRDASKFRRALTEPNFIARSDDPREQGRELDVRDVPMADAYNYWVRADVLATSPGAECVKYAAAGPDKEWFWLHRQVLGGTSCTGGKILLSETLVKNAPRIAGITDKDQPVFAYSILDEDCSTYVFAPGDGEAVPPDEVNRIMAVQLRVSGVVQRGKAASAASNVSLVGIRSRSAYDYRTALGC